MQNRNSPFSPCLTIFRSAAFSIPQTAAIAGTWLLLLCLIVGCTGTEEEDNVIVKLPYTGHQKKSVLSAVKPHARGRGSKQILLVPENYRKNARKHAKQIRHPRRNFRRRVLRRIMVPELPPAKKNFLFYKRHRKPRASESR